MESLWLNFQPDHSAGAHGFTRGPGHFLALLAAGVRVSLSLSLFRSFFFFPRRSFSPSLLPKLASFSFLFPPPSATRKRGGGFRTCPTILTRVLQFEIGSAIGSSDLFVMTYLVCRFVVCLFFFYLCIALHLNALCHTKAEIFRGSDSGRSTLSSLFFLSSDIAGY